MTGKTQKTEKGKKKSKEKSHKPERRNTTEKANSHKEIKKALKRINSKRIIIDVQDK